jgi:hypothetical protein
MRSTLRAASSPSPIGSLRRELDEKQARRLVRDMYGRRLTLSVSLERSRQLWSLSNGESVPDRVARIVIADPDIVGADDGLFNDCPQTYRHRYGGGPA